MAGALIPCPFGKGAWKNMSVTIKIRALECPENVIDVDEKSAGVMIARGTWELVDEEGETGGSRNAGRRNRTPRSNSTS